MQFGPLEDQVFIHKCTAIQGDDADERERMLQEITSVFTVTGKK